MSIEQIVKAGEFNFSESVKMGFGGDIPALLLLIVGILIICALFLFVMIVALTFVEGYNFFFKDKKVSIITIQSNPRFITAISTITVLICAVLLPIIIKMMANNAYYNHEGSPMVEWKQNAAFPYIASLPTQTQDIQAAKRIEKWETNTDYIDTKNANNDNLTPLNIYYADENDIGRELKTNAYVRFDLQKDAEPYMEFKELTQSLGHGLEPGLYTVTVHLPKGFYFNQ